MSICVLIIGHEEKMQEDDNIGDDTLSEIISQSGGDN